MAHKRKKLPRVFDAFPLRKIIRRISAYCPEIVLECGHVHIDCGQKKSARCNLCPKKEKS